MEPKKLKTYVKHIFELEESVFQQTQMAEKLKYDISQLPKKPTTEGTFVRFEKLKRQLPVIGSALGLLLVCIGMILYHNETYNYYLRKSLLNPDFIMPAETWFGWEFFGTGYLWLSLIPSILCFLVSGFIHYYSKLEKDLYQQKLDAYMRGEQKRQLLLQQLDAINTKLNQTKAVLQEFYNAADEDDAHYIHKDFRNLVAVSSFYQFLDRKQETSLPGCYTHYETAVFQHQVITKMDEIRQGMDQLRVNQEMLFQAVTRSNEINQTLHNDLSALNDKMAQNNRHLNDISRNTSLLEHNSKLTRLEEEHRRFLEELDRNS